MKIVVTGASGLVGSAVVRAAARRGWTAAAIVGRYSGSIAGAATVATLDLGDAAAAARAIAAASPDAVVNAAALSSPSACDANPALAQAVNVLLPATLAEAAAARGRRLVHISSEQVFDGAQAAPYSAADPASPVGLYGRQKLESEHVVAAAAPANSATVRAPLLMGNSLGGSRSVHERLFGDWAAGRVPQLFTDELRQPCTGDDLAEVLLDLCQRPDLCGVFHWAGAELISRFELGVRVRAHFELLEQNAPIAGALRRDVPGATETRQPRLALDVAPLAAALHRQPQSIAQQLATLALTPAAQAWCSTLRRERTPAVRATAASFP